MGTPTEALRAEASESEARLSYRGDSAWKTDEACGASGGQLGWERKRECVGLLRLRLQHRKQHKPAFLGMTGRMCRAIRHAPAPDNVSALCEVLEEGARHWGSNGTCNVLSQHVAVLKEDLLDADSLLLDLSHPGLFRRL